MPSISKEAGRKGWADAVEKVNRSRASMTRKNEQDTTAPARTGWASIVCRTNARRKGQHQ